MAEKALTIDQLMERVPNRADPLIFKKARYRAKRTKKGLLHFLYDLFIWNEIVPRAKKRTDQGLKDAILAEFPDNKKLRENLDTDTHGVRYYRQLYNTGILSRGQPGPYISFRYNMRGNRVDFTTGSKELTGAEQKKIVEKYGNRFMAKLEKRKKMQAARDEQIRKEWDAYQQTQAAESEPEPETKPETESP